LRRWLAASVAVVAVVSAAGCTASRGGGDVTDGWPMITAAHPFKPAAGTCHETLEATGSVDTYQPVDCKELHVSETFHIGTAQNAPVAPSAGSAPARQAYAECAAKAVDYLGGPWRGARIAVHLIWPSRKGWSGGTRWFRCDVTETDLDGQDDASRTGSLAGALAGDSPLKLGCFNPKVAEDAVNTMTPVACTAKHKAEYVGLWTAPDIPYAEQSKDRTRTAAGCRSVIAKYADLPDDADMQYRSGWISYNPSRAEWQLGERRVRCFLWFSDRTLTRSLKGAGPSVFPVN
jgi:hypothetical protein